MLEEPPSEEVKRTGEEEEAERRARDAVAQPKAGAVKDEEPDEGATGNAKKKMKTEEGKEAASGEEGEDFVALGPSKRLSVSTFKGSLLVDIREWYKDKKTDERKPGKKGISLTMEQWETLVGEGIPRMAELIERAEKKKK